MRLCIQTGFSDAGRYLGQTSASMAIERLRMTRASPCPYGLADVELVILDTHGESIKRGAPLLRPPGCYTSLLQPSADECLENCFKQEVSFQGRWLPTFPDRGFSLCYQALSDLEAGREGGRPYSDTSTSLDFFITKAFNEGLLSNENYAALLE